MSKKYTPAMMFRPTSAHLVYSRENAKYILSFLLERINDNCTYSADLYDAIMIQITALDKDTVSIASKHIDRIKFYPKYLKKAELPEPEGLDDLIDVVTAKPLRLANGEEVRQARENLIFMGRKP